MFNIGDIVIYKNGTGPYFAVNNDENAGTTTIVPQSGKHKTYEEYEADIPYGQPGMIKVPTSDLTLIKSREQQKNG